jgi:hypothetical protein
LSNSSVGSKLPKGHCGTERVVQQLLTVKNNRGEKIGHLGIECGFLHGDELVATGGQGKENVAAGETVYFEIDAIVDEKGVKVDRTDCRIENAWSDAQELQSSSADALLQAYKKSRGMR